jgi:hypothetical protein
MSPKGGPEINTNWPTDRLTVGRNIAWTWTWTWTARVVIGRAPDSTDRDKKRQFQNMERALWVKSSCGCGTEAVRKPRQGNVCQSTGEGQQTERTQGVCSELQTVCIRDSVKKKKLHGLSPRANYTDQRQSLVGEVIANFCG